MEIANCNFALKQYNMPLTVSVTKMNDKWNTEGGNYALVKNGSDYWFTSSRLTGAEKKHLNNIYTTTQQDSLAPALIKLRTNDDKNHIEFGTPSVDIARKRMYFNWMVQGWE